MPVKLILTGDLNLVNVTDPTVPFRHAASEFRAADAVLSNMECCLWQPAGGDAIDSESKHEGFFADPAAGGEALKYAGVHVVGIANNVNYGADAINSSVARLEQLGIAHSGAGANREAAHAPVIIERQGIRIGFLQRTAVYWPTNHEATKSAAGVAAIKCHTAYEIPMHRLRPDMLPPNRPGVPPLILTWVDREYLKSFKEDIAALRTRCDFVIASCHWGLNKEVVDYMTELAHAAIDAGADVVMGHGPHYSLAVENYKGKPVYYGLGSFCFHTGHGAKQHGNWVGMLARVSLERNQAPRASFQFVRHNERNETVLCSLEKEKAALDEITKASAAFDTKLSVRGDEVVID